MASKRIKKKRQKQAQQSKLIQAGYTQKEIKNLPIQTREKEIKRIDRNERAKELRNNKRTELLNSGVPLSIITRNRLDYKAIDFTDKKQLSEWRRKGEKLDAIRATGYKGKITDTQLRKSWNSLADEFSGLSIPEKQIKRQNARTPENDTLRLSGKTYLYIGVAEIKDGFRVDDLSNLSTNDIKDLVESRLREAQAAPDDSGSFSAAFKFSSGSKSDMEHRAKVMYKRGYDMNPQHLKMESNQYQKITVSNKWNKREFFEMFYTCISQMRNDDALAFNDHLKRYCQTNNFPFMDDMPFRRNK